MPDSEIRRAETGGRREGRRSHAAYGSHARGIRPLVGDSLALVRGKPRGPRPTTAGRHVRGAAPHEMRLGPTAAAWSTPDPKDAGAYNAGMALALVYPWVGRARAKKHAPPGVEPSAQGAGEGTGCMQRKPSIKSLETVSREEALAYLEYAGGDELIAAYALARDRNRLDGSLLAPDDAEVHHALFLLCRAGGKHAPSFDQMRFELRRRQVAA
jgi:hypothetical protein